MCKRVYRSSTAGTCNDGKINIFWLSGQIWGSERRLCACCVKLLPNNPEAMKSEPGNSGDKELLLPMSDASINEQRQRNNHNKTADNLVLAKKIGSALFYGGSSLMITVVNKTVLTYYHFPSFLVLSLGQMLAGILVLYCSKRLKLISFPNISADTAKKIFPLPLLYLGNMMFGLGGTQALSLPMFAALRRFSILMTMLLELRVLGIRPSVPVQISVYSMIGGALLAASDDLTFNADGYLYVMITNALTALNGVYMKKKLDTVDIGKNGLMFYNSLFMVLPALVGTWLIGDLHKSFVEFTLWTDPLFLFQFLLSCFMGFVLSYSTILCTLHNSALTTTIVGCLKNICVTYLGNFLLKLRQMQRSNLISCF